jgi:hypothetical protein
MENLIRQMENEKASATHLTKQITAHIVSDFAKQYLRPIGGASGSIDGAEEMVQRRRRVRWKDGKRGSSSESYENVLWRL